LTLKEGLTTRSGTTVSSLGVSDCLANHKTNEARSQINKTQKPKGTNTNKHQDKGNPKPETAPQG